MTWAILKTALIEYSHTEIVMNMKYESFSIFMWEKQLHWLRRYIVLELTWTGSFTAIASCKRKQYCYYTKLSSCSKVKVAYKFVYFKTLPLKPAYFIFLIHNYVNPQDNSLFVIIYFQKKCPETCRNSCNSPLVWAKMQYWWQWGMKIFITIWTKTKFAD